MSYENPLLPEEVNVGRENVLLEFLRLTAGLALVVALLSLTLYFAGGWLARQIPFEVERAWAGERPLADLLPADGSGRAAPALDAYLQQLVDALAAQMDLPAAMAPRVQLVERPEPNAFAGLGGQIVVTRGLYERMPSENALVLVLAHELAHLRARDPIAAIGGGSTLALMLTLLTGDAAHLSTAVATLIERGYSRRAETRADTAAIAALRRRYGHAGGGDAVFEVLAQYQAEHGVAVPTLLSTHPVDAERSARLRAAAADWNPQTAALRPLAVR